MAINSLSTANTFANWLAATNSLIVINNNLVDGTLSSNTRLLLTAPGYSLNVGNIAQINILSSNTITANSITTAYLNVSTNAIMLYANVINDLTVGNLLVRGVQSIGSVSFTNLSITGYMDATSYIEAGTYINQLGANSTFAGQTAFTNATTSFVATGNAFINKALVVSNVTVSTGGLITTPYLTVSSSIIGNANVTLNANIAGKLDVTGNISTTSNLIVSGTATITGNSTISGNVSIAKDLSVTGNTSIGPYTELVADLGTIVANTTLNLKTASVFKVNLGSDLALTLINPPASGRAVSATIYIKVGTGGSDLTIKGNTSTGTSGNIRYSYDTAPTLNTVINMVNIISAFTIDGGSNWYVSAPVIGSNTV